MATKTIFITGSSTGLGRAAALRFAREGWQVLATMRRPEQDAELAGHANVTLLPLDVTRPEQIEAAAARAIERGPVDVVFANAGYGLAGPLEGTSDEQIVREIDTNLLGVIRTTRAFIPHFRERRAGMFIATSSIGGLTTYPFNSVYHATKWALEGLYESLAFELSKFGIGVKTVSPGGIRTDFLGRSLVLARHPAYEELVARCSRGSWIRSARRATRRRSRSPTWCTRPPPTARISCATSPAWTRRPRSRSGAPPATRRSARASIRCSSGEPRDLGRRAAGLSVRGGIARRSSCRRRGLRACPLR